MLNVLQVIYKGDYYSQETATYLQDVLNWFMELNPDNALIYDALGSKGGTWASILTSNWYVIPKDGESLRLAVYYRELPIDIFGSWLQSGTHQFLELRTFAFNEGCQPFRDILENL